MSRHANRVKMTVSGSPGTGSITLLAASSGYRTFATAYGANATVDILITEGTSWEIARNCAYTNSGTTVNRGTLESSSSGSAVSFTSAAIVSVIATAAFGNAAESAIQSVTPGGRLTLESGVPVSATDQTAKTTIYYTPYLNNIVNLWDGNAWVPVVFAEVTEALGTLTNGRPYDVFGFLSAGLLDLEKLVWTNDTTRATQITLQDGRYCKSGDKTRLYLGTFYTSATTTTEDSKLKRFLWNMYNREPRPAQSPEGTQHTYDLTTLREWNNGSGTLPRCQLLCGIASTCTFIGQAFVTHTGGLNSTIRIYLDGSIDLSQSDIQFVNINVAAQFGAMTTGAATGYLSAGKHYATIFQAEYSGIPATYGKGVINSSGLMG